MTLTAAGRTAATACAVTTASRRFTTPSPTRGVDLSGAVELSAFLYPPLLLLYIDASENDSLFLSHYTATFDAYIYTRTLIISGLQYLVM